MTGLNFDFGFGFGLLN